MFSKTPVESFSHVGWYRQCSTAKSFFSASLTRICKSNYDYDIIYSDLGNIGIWCKSSLEVCRQRSRGGNDRLDDLASQEVEASSEVSVCLSVFCFYLAMWNADKELEKQDLWHLTLFSCAIKVFEVYQS